MIGPSLSRVILLKDSISIITSINVLAPTWLNDGDMPKDTKSGTMKGIVTMWVVWTF